MLKFIIKNVTSYTYRLTDIQGGSDHFGLPSMLAIGPEQPKGNEIEISERQFVTNGLDIYKLSRAGIIEIWVREGNKQAQATFDQVWKTLDKSSHAVWNQIHPRDYRQFRRQEVAGTTFPAPMPSGGSGMAPPAAPVQETVPLADVLPDRPGSPSPIPPAPPAAGSGPAKGGQGGIP